MNPTGGIRPSIRSGMILAGLLCACRGPLEPSVAIRQADQEQYEAAMNTGGLSSKEAFLRWRADLKGITFEEALIADAHLRKNPFDDDDRDAVSLGAVIYNAECRACHGDNAAGDGLSALPDHPPKNFRSTAARMQVALAGGAPGEWFEDVRDGHGSQVRYSQGQTRAMPAFRDRLSNEQIWLVLTFLAGSGDGD